MRFMIIVKATRDSEADVMPEAALIARMGKYHEELAQAGMLLDGSGLQPSSKGWRIRYSGGKTTFVDGKDGEIEVRQLFELDDFAPSEALDAMRDLQAGLASNPG